MYKYSSIIKISVNVGFRHDVKVTTGSKTGVDQEEISNASFAKQLLRHLTIFNRFFGHIPVRSEHHPYCPIQLYKSH